MGSREHAKRTCPPQCGFGPLLSTMERGTHCGKTCSRAQFGKPLRNSPTRSERGQHGGTVPNGVPPGPQVARNRGCRETAGKPTRGDTHFGRKVSSPRFTHLGMSPPLPNQSTPNNTHSHYNRKLCSKKQGFPDGLANESLTVKRKRLDLSRGLQPPCGQILLLQDD